MLPLSFGSTQILLYINAIKGCKVKYFLKHSVYVPSPNDIEQPIEANEIGIFVDDNMRRNATIVDV